MTTLKKALNEGRSSSNTLNNRRIALFISNGVSRKVVLVRRGVKTHRIRASLADGGGTTFKVPASTIRLTDEYLKTEEDLDVIENAVLERAANGS